MRNSIFTYEIYTDGSAKGRDAAHKLGGWAAVTLYNGDIVRTDSGYETDTTNNRMELRACAEGIKGAVLLAKNDPEANFVVYSDSAYLINCYTEGWWENWERNGYRGSTKKDVKNLDLWLEIIPYFKKRDNWHFVKVKGHADNYYNNLADKLAQEAAKAENVRRT